MQTATNPQTGEKIAWDGNEWKPVGGGRPSAPGIIRGRPKAPSPVREEVQQGNILSNQQKQASLAEAPLDIRKKQLDIEEKQRKLDAGDAGAASEGERKNAAFVRRAIGANDVYTALGIGPRSFVGDKLQEATPGLLNQLPSAIGNSSDRQQADAAEKEFVSAVLRSDSGAAIPDNEIATAIELYFPQPGDGDAVIQQKAEARQRAIDGLISSSGRLADEALAGEDKRAEPLSSRLVGGVQKGSEIEFGGSEEAFNRKEYLQEAFGITPQNEQAIMGFFNANRGKRLTPEQVNNFYSAMDIPAPQGDDLQRMIEQTASGEVEFGGIDTKDAEAARLAELEQYADQQEELTSEPGVADRLVSGGLLGLDDEIAGGAGAIAGLFNGDGVEKGYRDKRDGQRLRNERADERTGLLGDIAEVGGGLAIPVGTISSIGKAAKVGAGFGAVGGFGYGEGAGGSVANAFVGTALGGALGAGGQKFGNALLARAQQKAPDAANVNALAQAGQAEGVSVNRAMANPSLDTRVEGVAGTMAGKPKLTGEMHRIGDQIQGRVDDLGIGGMPHNSETGGDLVIGAADRFIEKSGKAAKVKYDRAEKLADGVKVKPKESLATVDDAIAKLSETKELNSAEITFLEKMKADFSNDLSVGALRRVRTSLRKKISRGELVFGEDEKTVLSVMDAASKDISDGLIAQGKGDAAKAFTSADKAYRARMDYITNTVQKVIGKRNANLSSEQAFRKFTAMATPNGNAKGLRQFYASLQPDEAMDVAATFAEELGRNPKGQFSTAYLIKQAEKMPDSAKRTIFGPKGAESLENLVTLSKAHDRVYSKIGGSQTGVRNDYRGWLTNLFVGGGAGLALDGLVTGGVGAASGLAAKAGRDRISANLLMSPKITKWLKSAPRTKDGKVIDSHFSKLGRIAKAEPALASDISILQDLIVKTANDNPGRAAAQDE